MHLSTPQTQSDWDAYYDVRFRILRQPWGQAPGSERDETDVDSYNAMLRDDSQRVLAVGRLHLNSPAEAQVRYMAVETDQQGKGVGRVMMEALEAEARRLGAQHVFLEAREPAVEFYRRLGYEVLRPSYLLFGEIQHYSMQKQL